MKRVKEDRETLKALTKLKNMNSEIEKEFSLLYKLHERYEHECLIAGNMTEEYKIIYDYEFSECFDMVDDYCLEIELLLNDLQYFLKTAA